MKKLQLLGASMAAMIAPLMARGDVRRTSLYKQDPIDANEQRIVAADKRARRGLRLCKENR